MTSDLRARAGPIDFAKRVFAHAAVRYLFGAATVASAFGLRLLLYRWTGKGAPFVLVFGATLVTSLVAGAGPGLMALALSLPIAAIAFAMPAGATPSQAAFQALLYALDGLIIIELTHLMRVARERLQRANRDLGETAARLAASEARTREIINLSPEAYFQANLDARFVDVNAAAARMLGYDRDELVGRTILDIIPAEDAHRLADVRTELARPGATHIGEWIQLRKDGTPVPVEVSSNILPDGRWQAFVRDISERKRAEAERERTTERLRQSEEEFRLIFEEAPIGVALVALDGRFVRVNRALCEILGYSAVELEKLSYQEITPPDELPAAVAPAERVNRGETSKYQIEKHYVRKDGSTVEISVNGSIVYDRHGQRSHYIAQIEDITERKRAEEALRQSELKFRRLVDTMPDGVLIRRGENIIYANGRLATLLGYDDASALHGRAVADFVSPASLGVVQARARLVQEMGQMAPPQELTLLRRDGSPVIVETVGIGVEFEGAPAIVVVVRDLTERVRAEQALRFSEAKFSGIVSISADAIISIDDEQRITVFNAGAEQIFGYSRDEVLGASLDLLIPSPFRESHRRDVESFAAGPVTARRMGERLASIRGRRKSGAEFAAEASISNLDVGGKKFLTVVLRDVSERERLDREQRILAEVSGVLAASLDYERTLATVARIAVRDFADWCVVEVMETSEGPRRLKAASADPAKAAIADRFDHIAIDRGRPYMIRSVVESHQPLLIPHVTAAQLEASAQSLEHLEILRAIAPTSLIAVPLLHRDRLLGTLSFVSSTPSRIYAPSDLRLANGVAERAALAIENARLYRAALHATGLRDQVLGVVAHDLRNPLGTIALHAGALQRPEPQPERRSQKHKEAIERATRRMNRLIQDLLDVAVLEAGHLKVARVPIATADLVSEAVEMQRALAASSSIDLREAVAADVPAVLGDRDRLLQVFENLIGNALKFTDPGGQVTVGAARSERGAIFWVADTGRGMTQDDLARIFDRFWQASARSGRLGAGLGLPITKGIIEAHGGEVWVESASGQGSTFFFSIPQAPAAGAPTSDAVH